MHCYSEFALTGVHRNAPRSFSRCILCRPTNELLISCQIFLAFAGLIQEFLNMIRTDPTIETVGSVFVLPIFELEANVTMLPDTKAELVELLGIGMAIPFHQQACSSCHAQPGADDWVNHALAENGESFAVRTLMMKTLP